MQMELQSSPTLFGLTPISWGTAFVGEVVDERGESSVQYVSHFARTSIKTEFNLGSFEITYDNQVFSIDDAEGWLQGVEEPVLFETTTLGFPEILITLRGLRERGVRELYFLYTEPGSYKRKAVGPNSIVLHRRDFDLTEKVEVFTGIPGYAVMVDMNLVHAVFLLGYEGQRLEQGLDQISLDPANVSLVMGVPAFQAGWEMDTFSNNLNVITEWKVGRSIQFTGAHSPFGAYKAIERVHETVAASSERILLVPIGTKPHGIGVALYASVHTDVGVMYDFPKRSKGRTDSIHTWHLFKALF